MLILRYRQYACSHHLLGQGLTNYLCRRYLLTLAIETSCDDTCVAVLEKHNDLPTQNSLASQRPCATLHFHEKITADNSQFHGIHPLTSLESHQTNLGSLINKALRSLPSPPKKSSNTITVKALDHFDGASSQKLKPDLISVTRGPGMRSSLFTGLDTAKGLAIAWQIPLVGVHHMQAHALTPRLVSALNSASPTLSPPFPFFSLLVSGGHTLLIWSQNLTNHSILAKTADIAIGDALDKIARRVLPQNIIDSTSEVTYARLLEAFVFPLSSPSDSPNYDYTPPYRRVDELARYESPWGWTLGIPLAETDSGSKSKSMKFSFSGLESACKRVIEKRGAEMGEQERKELGREAMRISFEHLASRIVIALQKMQGQSQDTLEESVITVVVSGGVASNGFLRTILRAFLSARSFPNVQFVFPPPSLCTDNAAMIGWTGIEMHEAGLEDDLSCTALRKWSIEDLEREQ